MNSGTGTAWSPLVLMERLMGHEERVWCVKWNPQGTLLASCGGDRKILVWGQQRPPETSTASEASRVEGSSSRWVAKVCLTEGHTRTVRGVAWSPSGLYLASCSFDRTIAIWKRQLDDDSQQWTFGAIATLEGHENEVKSVAWSASGQYLASCSRDKSVWIWSCEYDDEYDCLSVLHSHSQDVKRVAWSPVDDVLVSCSYDNTAKLYKNDPNDDDWTCSETLNGHDSTVWGVCFDNSGRRLATCSDDNTIKIWQYFEGDVPAAPGSQGEGNGTPGFKAKRKTETSSHWRCVCTLSGQHERTIFDVDWSHVHGALATGSADDGLRVFEEDSNVRDRLREPQFNLAAHQRSAHAQDVNAVTWNPHSDTADLLASCGDDGMVHIWRYTRPS